MAVLKNLIGQRFGRLVVVSRAPNELRKNAKWNCLCDCGSTTVVAVSSLISGRTQSCKCKRVDFAKKAFTDHGKSESLEFDVWQGMKQRCYNPNNSRYAICGGLGIRVCERWLESFPNFLADMGERPSPDHRFGRIDINKDYSPENCRWVTSKEHAFNRRSTVIVEMNGESHPITEWIRRLGLNTSTVYKRLGRGLSLVEALQPPKPRRNSAQAKSRSPS
ncbi:hypothetical protein [Noviherbaspirillum malthae]|jgi:hypothetical protein|uniref:hypothetical protein n=1 Tax=Noviherbaspirillum malthae TaxID=1260987 RepID=UPI00188E1733|nr:hypothetical protein [Noviherbaspirillum malthae]